MKRLAWPLLEVVVVLSFSVLIGYLLGIPIIIALVVSLVVYVGMVVIDRLRDRLAKPKQKTDEGLKPGTYRVVCGQVDTVSPEAGNGKEHRVEVVLVVRPLEDGSAELQLVVIPKEWLLKGNLANSARVIAENHPSFCLRIEPDGTRVLFQETAEAVRLHELVFSP